MMADCGQPLLWLSTIALVTEPMEAGRGESRLEQEQSPFYL
jgi:hypothetical protein